VHPVGDGCTRRQRPRRHAGAVRCAWRSDAVTIPSGRLAERTVAVPRRPRRHHVCGAKE
jgi:hypothetical protein